MLRTDLPFARDDANKFLPWMIALMCALAALLLLVGVALQHWVTEQKGSFSNQLSVQVPDHGPRQQGLIRQVSELLEKTPGVRHVRVFSSDEVGKLLAPWLGDAAAIEDLPLPTVIDVAVLPSNTQNYDPIIKQLQAISPDITLDTRATWMEKFSHFSRISQLILYTLTAAIISTLALMMVFSARAALKLHASTVQLLHSLGATDRYIASQFQHNALRMAARGAFPGTFLAGILYMLFSLYASHLDAPLLPHFTFSLVHIVLLCALPVLCCALSVAAVRRSTIRYLQKLH